MQHPARIVPPLTTRLSRFETWGSLPARNSGTWGQTTVAENALVPYTTTPDRTASGHHPGEGRCPSGNRSSTNVARVPSAGIHAHTPSQTIGLAAGSHEPVTKNLPK